MKANDRFAFLEGLIELLSHELDNIEKITPYVAGSPEIFAAVDRARETANEIAGSLLKLRSDSARDKVGSLKSRRKPQG